MLNYESVDAVCPYYRNSGKVSIKCEGFLRGTTMAVTFRKPTKKQRYFREKCACMDGWPSCLLARLIGLKYEE